MTDSHTPKIVCGVGFVANRQLNQKIIIVILVQISPPFPLKVAAC